MSQRRPSATALDRAGRRLAAVCGVALPLFTLVEVNYPLLAPMSRLAVFASLGLALCLLREPAGEDRPPTAALDLVLVLLTAAVCGYVVVQTEPLFARWWLAGQSLGDRAGAEHAADLAAGAVGLVIVLEATRRSLGLPLPILSLAFLAYGRLGHLLPDILLPHRGYGVERLVSQTFLHSQGVFGIALSVMFSYVFLFVLFGVLLEATGATAYIIDGSRLLLGRTRGGPAKVAVLSSGLLGSLSGSAVANTATTGTFTIPMMRSAGFPPHLAAGVEAAASSGGALVPPVMGAGAYMMLEIIDPPVTYLQIIRAALIPACLYYLCLFLIVHFHTSRMPPEPPAVEPSGHPLRQLLRFEGVLLLAALGSLIVLLVRGYSVFRSVTLAMAVTLVLSSLHRRSRPTVRKLYATLRGSSRGGVSLVAAAACVGIIIGVVTLTGVGTRLPALLLPLAEEHLLLALVVMMVSSIVLGMGLPSAVCYLLMATLVGPVLGRLGVVPLAAHLFIFYFGMMSMVTPPVALAAYAASSIAGAPFMRSSSAAFRFALGGFALPYLFVFRPQLLLLRPTGEPAGPAEFLPAALLAILAVIPLAAAVSGFLAGRLGAAGRLLVLLAAVLTLHPWGAPLGATGASAANLVGAGLLLVVLMVQRRRARRAGSGCERTTPP